MNFKYLIKPVAAFALICGAPLLQAQVLGGGATGGLGGTLGGTLGGGTGSIGGMGQGGVGGTLGGSLDHGDTLRRHATGTVDRTREISGRVRDRAASTRDTVQGTAASTASSASGQVSGAASGAASTATNGIAGSVNAAGNAAGSAQQTTSGMSNTANGNLAGDLRGLCRRRADLPAERPGVAGPERSGRTECAGAASAALGGQARGGEWRRLRRSHRCARYGPRSGAPVE